MTNLPWNLRRALFAPVTSDDLIALLTINHPDWDSPVRMSSQASERFSVDPLREGTTHGGNIYDYRVLSAMLPDDDEASLPSIPVVIENVVQDLGSLLDEEIEDCTVTLVYVRKNDPEEIAQTFPDFLIGEVSAQNETLALSLSLGEIEVEPFPQFKFTPFTTPGLFR